MRPDPVREALYATFASAFLEANGFVTLGPWRHRKGGRVYDLSAADLEQLDRIERDGLFVVAEAA